MPKGRKTWFDGIVSRIAPSEKELDEERKLAAMLVKRIDRCLPAHGRAMLAGSVAKGTFLKDSKDIDIFILFPKSVGKERFEQLARGVAAKAFPKERKAIHYAEHPYVRIIFGARKIDLVPAYDIKTAEEKASAVDRSVLHTKYILRKLPDAKRADVLLLKKLFKANGLYGAEIRVEGFSGYLCELLVIRYGGFMNAMRAMGKWRMPVVIDIEKHYANSARPLEKFPKSSLIVIDPVDKQRNVAAIVSEENMERAIMLAKKVVANPTAAGKLFSGCEKEFKEKELMKLLATGKQVYKLSFRKPHVVDDILWGQLKRLEKNIVAGLEHLEFEVSGTLLREENGICELFFRLKEDHLGSKMLLKGPPLRDDLERNIVQFRKSHRSARFVKKNGHVFAIVKREVRDARHALKLILSKEQNVPSHIPAARVKMKKIKKQK